MVFLNKMDRPGASFHFSLTSLLNHRFHPHPMALTLPIASFDPRDYTNAEPGIQGLVDLVKWQIWKWNKDDKPMCYPLPSKASDVQKGTDILPPSHPIIPHLVPARTALLENLSMFSEELMEDLLNEDEHSLYLKTPDLVRHLRHATLHRHILPVLCGSAVKHIGTNLVLDYVGELLASPLDVADRPPAHNDSLRLLAWKVTWDRKKGWMTFVRVYSGTLVKNMPIFNINRNTPEKASKLLLLYASQAEEVKQLPFGSVGVVLGLKHTRTGDTLVAAAAPRSTRSSMRDIVPPPAVVSASVIPQSHSDLEPVQLALQNLSRTDPSVRVDVQEGQILVHGLGSLHLEIVEGRLRDEWNVQFEFGKRRVSYREGLSSTVLPTDQNETIEVGGVPISVSFDIRPLNEEQEGDPTWDGNVVVDAKGNPFPTPDSISGTPEAYVAAGISSSLSNSPHSSLPMSRVFIQVENYIVPSPPSLLTAASAITVRNHLRRAGLGSIMEPYFYFTVSAPEDVIGKVVKDLTESGGEILDMAVGLTSVDDAGAEEAQAYSEDAVYVPPLILSPAATRSTSQGSAGSSRLKRTVRAVAPLSRMLDYSNRLRALSGGHGQFQMANAGFREVSEPRKMEILREIGRA